MASERDRLAERRKLLLARSSLQRLELVAGAQALRESLRWPRVGAAIAGSQPVRSALIGVLLGAAGRRTATRLVRGAAIAFAVYKVAGLLLRPSPRPSPKGEGEH